ncbi:hypothetical protein RG903_06120 [Thermithiobacillus tepidarius DSM 3134]|uniref:hypothetical protein n=1 Tax=Thermithiobacillus tepidarius TaxID=929 RepID=UPI0004002F3A|nr:hypothetical protein [Thermithiobacillus tepidarius]
MVAKYQPFGRVPARVPAAISVRRRAMFANFRSGKASKKARDHRSESAKRVFLPDRSARRFQ